MNLQQNGFFENCQKVSSILFLGYHLNSVLLVLWERVFAIQFYFNIPVCAGGLPTTCTSSLSAKSSVALSSYFLF